MSNLFNRLANRALGKTNRVRPQSSAAFFADAPALEQDAVLENNMEQTVSQKRTENQKIVEPQVPVYESGKLSTNQANLSAPTSQSKNQIVRNDILSDRPDTTEITETFEARQTPHTLYSPLMKSTEQKIILNDHDGNADILSPHVDIGSHNPLNIYPNKNNSLISNEAPVEESHTDHVDERINISNRNIYAKNEQSVQINNKNEFKPLLKQQTDALDVVSKSTAVPLPNTKDAASETVEVHVSIGRIEVKAARQLPATEPKKAKAKKNAPMSLEAYLAERESGKR